MLRKVEYLVPPHGSLQVAVPFLDRLGKPFTAPISITLKDPLPPSPTHSGATVPPRAEIAGAELAVDRPVQLRVGRCVSVFSPTGCLLVVEGPPQALDAAYCDMVGVAYQKTVLELHYWLEKRRVDARASEVFGPRVLVCGVEPDSGKSTLVTTLANLAVRFGYHPTVVNLDSDNPSLGYPMCLDVYNLQSPIDPEADLCSIPGHHVLFGSKTHSSNAGLYRSCLKEVAADVNAKLQEKRVVLGGVVVDFPTVGMDLTVDVEREVSQLEQHSEKQAAKQKSPLEILKHTILALDIDVVVVVGSSWLKNKLFATMNLQAEHPSGSESIIVAENGAEISVVCIEAAPHAVARTEWERELARRDTWERYFFGSAQMPVSPIKIQSNFSNIRILQLKMISSAEMQTLLSIDRGEDDEAIHQEDVWRSPVILGDVVALSSATFADREGHDISELKFTSQLNRCHVLGFATVLSVDTTTGAIELLCPTDLPQARGCCFLTSNA